MADERPERGRPDYGYFPISRKCFLPVEQGGNKYWNERRTYSRWEAFEDLLFMAAHTTHTRSVQGHRVVVPRGYLLASVRFLADRWLWSKAKVARFVGELVHDETLAPARETAIGTLYRLVNYEVWNKRETADETPTRTATGHQRGQQRDKENNENNEKKGERRNPATRNWVARMGEIKLRITGGALHMKAAAGQCAALVKHHGEDEFLRVWEFACERAVAENAPQKLKPAFFAEDFGYWQRRAGEPGVKIMTDDLGILRKWHERDGEWVPGEVVEDAA